jgi:hypothetical protein
MTQATGPFDERAPARPLDESAPTESPTDGAAAAESAAATEAAAEAAAMHAAAVREDRRLATLHLRLGGLLLARAELEDLRRRGELDARGLAELAEARWRGGDLPGAADAAAEHLAAGGSRSISRVIAAEAAAAAGHPVEARAHVEALGAVDGASLDRLFGGMPRRAFWPSAPNAPVGLEELAAEGRTTESAAGAGGSRTESSGGRLSEGPPAMAGLWDDEPSLGGRQATRSARTPAEPPEELARARDELRSDDAEVVGRGLARLALVLRLDPTLAPAVLDAVGQRREAGALLVRGDAYRLVGRRLEAEAAFGAAARALDPPDASGG